MATGVFDDGEVAAELLVVVEEQLREQQEEESTNLYVSVKALRAFFSAQNQAQLTFLTVIMCVLSVERLAYNRGTRVILVDGFMQPHLKAYSLKLSKMDSISRDERVLSITVWVPKVRSVAKPRFQVGAVYEMKKIHGLKFWHEVLQGNLQSVGPTNPGLIDEHADFAAIKRSRYEANLRARRAGDDNDEEKEESTEESME